MPLTDRLERRGGLFIDSASTLFFGGIGFGSGELPEDNSSSAAASLSSDWISSLPLFCLTALGGHSLLHFRPVHPLGESVGDRFLAVNGQHGSAVRPSVWHVPLASPPYPSANEGTDHRGTDSPGCWS